MCTHKGVHCSIDVVLVLGAVLHLCAKVYLFQERIQFLDRYTATPDQYLVIKDREGRLEHIPG